MPKCPKCGTEINSLKVILKESGELTIVDGAPVYDWYADIYGSAVVEASFICPECEEELFSDDKEAEAFLQEAEGDGCR